jgi:glycosyltransferase involved in cell wall biosynthesis
MPEISWIVCQLGAREHYAVPRAIAQRGNLYCLLTDAWEASDSVLGQFDKRLRERFHSDLANEHVRAWTVGLVAFETWARLRRLSGWDLILARNRWFQNRISRYLLTLFPKSVSNPSCVDQRPVVFCYSYTALAPFRAAKRRGWRTILGQIDPGRYHDRIVADLYNRCPQYAHDRQFAPAEYWTAWHEECSLADVIMVNSEWSKTALLAEGVAAEQIAVVPLAYQPPSGSEGISRHHPEAISSERPLRVLFLGNVNLCKGIHDLACAAELLKDAPVVFDVVGNQTSVPPGLSTGNVRFHGKVSRTEVSVWYQHADLFVLPTYSDGFALTQLEAMAYGLPVIATPRCGSVVQPGLNGWLIEPGCPEQLAGVIREVISHPFALAEMSAAATRRAGEFSIERLTDSLCQLEIASRNCSFLTTKQ